MSAEMFNPHKGGIAYVAFMKLVANQLNARSYFEIGTSKGRSLSAMTCAAVAVDPAMSLTFDVLGAKPFCHLFQMPADAFFANHDLRTYLPQGPDICFLDGMHRFEFLLRDFMNTEKACRSNSIIFLHDCLPISPRLAARGAGIKPALDAKRPIDPAIKGWTGDVFKILPILAKYRPDLSVYPLDCPTTGVVMITGLDPSSDVLDRHYNEIVREFAAFETQPGWFDTFYDSITIHSTRQILLPGVLTTYCWL